MQERMLTVRQVWAVVRVDESTLPATRAEDLETRVTVKEILLDEGLAAYEVRRLNDLNRDKGAYYFRQLTRLRDREGNVIPPTE